jgi:pyruvate/2-oxoglutarate dehydrogenase complex dihydrolipoamide dehydrogenase (E3) component
LPRSGDRLIPHVVFTDPQLGHVGLNQSEAQRQGIAVRVARLPMKNVLRTEATDETDGFMKVLVGAKDDRIVGFSVMTSAASEPIIGTRTSSVAQKYMFG